MGFVAIKGSGRQWRWWWNDGLLYSSLVKSATTSEEASKNGYVKQEQECFWPLFWSHHYRANGTVASNEKAFSAGGANVRWNSTMMLNDPKNNINPAVFISIFFFREHLSASNKHICFLQLFLRWNKSCKALAGAVAGTMNLFILHVNCQILL